MYGWLWPLAVAALVGTDCSEDPGPIPSHLSDCTHAEGDPLDILGASIDGDVLTVDVRFGGGCEVHDIVLCWPDQSFLESEPVQVRLELWHDDHGDLCRALVYESRRFELGPLADAWHEAYGPGPGTILVDIGPMPLAYTF